MTLVTSRVYDVAKINAKSPNNYRWAYFISYAANDWDLDIPTLDVLFGHFPYGP